MHACRSTLEDPITVPFTCLLLGSIGPGCGSSPPPKPEPEPKEEIDIGAPPVDVLTPDDADPYRWLEDVRGDRAMAWVKEQNARSTGELGAAPGFDALVARALAIINSKEKIPYVSKVGKYLVNFWKDDKNQRGLWRRTTLAEYRKASPKWEVLLDVDALGKAENESWVWEGADCLYPKYERCLLSLSRGGGDATVVREFDVTRKAFVDPASGGFVVPEAKNMVGWKDLDTLYVGTDFGPGSMTDSGYPRIAKEWKRGTPLSAATTIFEGKQNDIEVVAYRQHDHGRVRDFVYVAPTFFTSDVSLIVDGGLRHIDKPADAVLSMWDDQALIELRTDWRVGDQVWPAGALLAFDEAAFLAGKHDQATMLFTPRATSSLSGTTVTKSAILVNELEDVHNTLFRWKRGKPGKDAWQREAVAMPPLASFSVSAWDDEENDDYWVVETGYLTPATLALVQRGKSQVMKRAPAFFDTKGLEVTQHFVTSKDGTRVPYFQVSRSGMALDGSHPTIIEGYGGFELSMTPFYSGIIGSAWLERGGVYVTPNLRGGGEYGPNWHTSAIKENRQRVFDDFAAIAQDLIARGVTRPDKLGISGGSNGGLLVGVMMTQHPELFGAVVCSNPLLDMWRYSKLLAGASWMDEYGNPDVPAEWAYISKYSPFQNVQPGVKYPRVLFTTATSDDRVHPAHARKMMARMQEQGHDALFWENTEGGHAGAADSSQKAHLVALEYTFLAKQLGL